MIPGLLSGVECLDFLRGGFPASLVMGKNFLWTVSKMRGRKTGAIGVRKNAKPDTLKVNEIPSFSSGSASQGPSAMEPQTWEDVAIYMTGLSTSDPAKFKSVSSVYEDIFTRLISESISRKSIFGSMTSATRSISVNHSEALPVEVKESEDTVPLEVKMENDHESSRRKGPTDAAVVKRPRGRPRKDSVQPKSEVSQQYTQDTLTSFFMVTSEPATNPAPILESSPSL